MAKESANETSRGEASIPVRTLALAAAAVAAFAWAFGPVLGDLIQIWWSVADYSHGFLIVPLALYVAWSRRSSLPRRFRPSMWGAALLAVSVGARYLALYFSLMSLERYSLLPAVAGLVLLLGGKRLLLWALPMIAYLVFMIPVPQSIATSLAGPLQNMGAAGAAYLLQAAGVPAWQDGTTLLIENATLNVAFACSGLQMIISFGAVCVAIAMLTHYPPMGKLAISASAIPIAIGANIVRIALISWGRRFDLVPPKELHDAGGIIIVPFTVAIVFLGIYLFEKCFPKRRRVVAA